MPQSLHFSRPGSVKIAKLQFLFPALNNIMRTSEYCWSRRRFIQHYCRRLWFNFWETFWPCSCTEDPHEGWFHKKVSNERCEQRPQHVGTAFRELKQRRTSLIHWFSCGISIPSEDDSWSYYSRERCGQTRYQGGRGTFHSTVLPTVWIPSMRGCCWSCLQTRTFDPSIIPIYELPADPVAHE